MSSSISRRGFLKNTSLASAGLAWTTAVPAAFSDDFPNQPYPGIPSGGRVGIIGLDTSHSTSFVDALNGLSPDSALEGYRIVAAYPYGSRDIQSSAERIPAYTDYVKRFDVKIVDSIDDLLHQSDVIMLETNDGRPHLEQALPVLRAGKRLFIDKPVAASLEDVLTIYETARYYKVPVFSASSLRYNTGVQEAAAGKTVGKVLGADTFSPSPIEKTQPDFFWYGIHGVEMLCTLMGKGCREVRRIGNADTDVVVGTWDDGRIGSFRGTRTGQHEYGGTVFGENGVQRVGPYSGYNALLKQVIHFFKTGISPVPEEETLEIYAFMEAAHESKRSGGNAVSPAAVLEHARKNVKKYT